MKWQYTAAADQDPDFILLSVDFTGRPVEVTSQEKSALPKRVLW